MTTMSVSIDLHYFLDHKTRVYKMIEGILLFFCKLERSVASVLFGKPRVCAAHEIRTAEDQCLWTHFRCNTKIKKTLCVLTARKSKCSWDLMSLFKMLF